MLKLQITDLPKDVCHEIVKFVNLSDAIVLAQADIFPEIKNDLRTKALKYIAFHATMRRRNKEWYRAISVMNKQSNTDGQRIRASHIILGTIKDDLQHRIYALNEESKQDYKSSILEMLKQVTNALENKVICELVPITNSMVEQFMKTIQPDLEAFSCNWTRSIKYEYLHFVYLKTITVDINEKPEIRMHAFNRLVDNAYEDDYYSYLDQDEYPLDIFKSFERDCAYARRTNPHPTNFLKSMEKFIPFLFSLIDVQIDIPDDYTDAFSDYYFSTWAD